MRFSVVGQNNKYSDYDFEKKGFPFGMTEAKKSPHMS